MRRAGTALALSLLLPLACAAVASADVATAPFFPFHDGDLRVLGTAKGTGFDTVSGPVKVGKRDAWAEILTDEWGAEQFAGYWTQDTSGTHLIAAGYQGVTVSPNPPITYPASVKAGDVFDYSGNLLAGSLPIPVGTFTARIEIIATDASASTPAGDFTGCLDSKITVAFTVGTASKTWSFHQVSAANVGSAQFTQDPDDAAALVASLLYASVGGTDYGKGPVDTASYFPLNQGDRWVFHHFGAYGAFVYNTVWATGAQTGFAGKTVFPITEVGPDYTSAGYWYRDTGNTFTNGRADRDGAGFSYDPAQLLLHATVYEGQHMYTEGKLLGVGTGVQASRTADVLIAETGAKISLPGFANAFTDCLRLHVTVAEAAPGAPVDCELILAPGLGVISRTAYSPTALAAGGPGPTVTSQDQLQWARVTGIEEGQNPAVDTPPFFPLASGDTRAYLHTGGLRTETVGDQIDLGGTQVWPFRSSGFAGDTEAYFSRGVDTITLHNGLKDVETIVFSPASLLLAAKVRAGDVLHSEGTFTTDGAGALPYSFDLTILDTDASVTVAAGAFSHCLQLRRQGAMGAEPDVTSFDEVWYLATDVGLVKCVPKADAAAAFELAYAKVGGVTYGQPPSIADTRPFFPIAAGDHRRYDWSKTIEHTEDQVVQAPAVFHGFTASAFQSSSADTRFWYRDAAVGLTSLVGWRRLFPPLSYEVSFDHGVLLMGPTATLGDVNHSSGTAVFSTGASVPYSFTVTVSGVGQTVTTIAGTFDDCLVLRLQGTIGSGPSGETLDQYLTLASGVGIVKVDGSSGDITWQGELSYAKVGGTEYGTALSPQPTTGYLPLVQEDTFAYRYQGGTIERVTVAPPLKEGGIDRYSFFRGPLGATVPSGADWFYSAAADGDLLWRRATGPDSVTYEPGGLFLPTEAYPGMVLRGEGDLTAGGAKVGTYIRWVTYQAPPITVSTPAGAFTDCVGAEVHESNQVGATQTSSVLRHFLARDVGLVELDDINTAANSKELVWARVDGHEYGTRPLMVGDLNHDDVIDAGDAILLLQSYIGGQPAYVQERDIAPYAGTPPDITPQPDGKVDEADLQAFMLIWRARHPGP